MMQPPVSRLWHEEYIIRQDAKTGRRVIQLTSAPLCHETVYPEAPVWTPDGHGLVYIRRQSFDDYRRYWYADLNSFSLRQLTDEPGTLGAAITPDGKWLYYMAETAAGVEFKRLSLDNFERESLTVTKKFYEAYELGSIRSDGAAYVTAGNLGLREWGVVRFDLQDFSCEVIYQSDQICNAHPQYSPGRSYDVLIQENHGCLFDDQGRCLALTSGYGADLHVISDDGTNLRNVPVGCNDLEVIQGHQMWLGDTGEVLVTTAHRERSDEAFVTDEIVVAEPGTDKRRIIAKGAAFGHPCTSPDGQWWVCDEFGTANIYLGNAISGQYELLVKSGASFGAPSYTHPHPALSPDGRFVAYNSDMTGVPHVYLACVDDELRQRLVPPRSC